MSELSRLSQALVDRPLVERPELGALRARNRRHRNRRVSLLAAVVVLAVLCVLGLDQLPSRGRQGPGRARLASYFQAALSVPGSTLSVVGLPTSVSVPTKVSPIAATTAGRARVSYVGAEYCPFCALQRWALLVALSQFGSFTHLNDAVFSSSTDVYPHLASWSFVGARYSSSYLSFEATELYSSLPDGKGGYQALQAMTPAQGSAFHHYDSQAALPFVDIGEHYVTIGASSSPSVLEGLTLEQIGQDLADPSSPVAKAVDGAANYLIAAMCEVVQGTKPAVCSSLTTTRALVALSSGIAPTSTTTGQPPAQPLETAPMSAWQRWSVEMHRYLDAQLAYAVAKTDGRCVVTKATVTGSRLTKPELGIPAGVTVWAIDEVGDCRPRRQG